MGVGMWRSDSFLYVPLPCCLCSFPHLCRLISDASSRVSHLLLVSSSGSVVFNSSSALMLCRLVVKASGGNCVSAPVFVLIERRSINGFLFF